MINFGPCEIFSVFQLVEAINTVKMWIQLNVPRIEDGNNFGVSIQEETINELGRAEVYYSLQWKIFAICD